MTRKNVGPRSSTICAVLLSAAALLSAAPASADETDDAFVAALENYGINIDRNAAIAMGHDVCTALDNGHDESFLVLDVIHDAKLPARQAGYFVGVSVTAYCPQYKGTLDPSLRQLLPGFPHWM